MVKSFSKRHRFLMILFLLMIVFQLIDVGMTHYQEQLFPDFEALFLDTNGTLYARTVQGRLMRIQDGCQLLENIADLGAQPNIAVYEGNIVVVLKGTGKCIAAYDLGGKPLNELPELPDTFQLDSKGCGGYRIERSLWFSKITFHGEKLVQRGTMELYNTLNIACSIIYLVLFCWLAVLLLANRRPAKGSNAEENCA